MTFHKKKIFVSIIFFLFCFAIFLIAEKIKTVKSEDSTTKNGDCSATISDLTVTPPTGLAPGDSYSVGVSFSTSYSCPSCPGCNPNTGETGCCEWRHGTPFSGTSVTADGLTRGSASFNPIPLGPFTVQSSNCNIIKGCEHTNGGYTLFGTDSLSFYVGYGAFGGGGPNNESGINVGGTGVSGSRNFKIECPLINLINFTCAPYCEGADCDSGGGGGGGTGGTGGIGCSGPGCNCSGAGCGCLGSDCDCVGSGCSCLGSGCSCSGPDCGCLGSGCSCSGPDCGCVGSGCDGGSSGNSGGCGSANGNANGIANYLNGTATTVKPTGNFCPSGSTIYDNNPGTAGDPWTWSCKSSNGTISYCSSPGLVTTSKNGKCGSANGKNCSSAQNGSFNYLLYSQNNTLCANGEAEHLSCSGYWSCPCTWDCVGSGGGATVNCAASGTTTGKCGSANRTYPIGSTAFAPYSLCTSGTASPASPAFPTISAPTTSWTCSGSATICKADLCVDSGLRTQSNNKKVVIAGQSPGNATSPLRIKENGGIWGVLLVNPGDPYDSGARIQTSSGTKALKKCYSVTDTSANSYISEVSYIWVANWGDYTVTKLDSLGNKIGTYNTGSGLRYIAVDASGNVWITKGNGTIVKLHPDGTPYPGSPYSIGQDPAKISFDGSGNVWVVNNDDDTVTKINGLNGSVIGTYPTFVGDSNGSNGPFGIAVDGSGNVWVTNWLGFDGNSVTKLDSSGNKIGIYTVGKGPYQITVDASGNAWVINSGDNTITKLNSSGGLIGTYHVGVGPRGIAIDASGNVWVTNSVDNTVTKLNSSGSKIGVYNVGQAPLEIAVDASGNVWVVNSDDNTITNLNGSTGAIIGTYPVGISPNGIAVSQQ